MDDVVGVLEQNFVPDALRQLRFARSDRTEDGGDVVAAHGLAEVGIVLHVMLR